MTLEIRQEIKEHMDKIILDKFKSIYKNCNDYGFEDEEERQRYCLGILYQKMFPAVE